MIAKEIDVHVVQVGTDDSVFCEGASSDTMERQLLYAEILKSLNADSSISNIIISQRDYTLIRTLHARFTPVAGGRVISFFSTFSALYAHYRQRRISLITFQEPSSYALAAWVFAKIFSIPVLGQVHFDPYATDTGGDEGLARQGVRSKIRTALSLRLLFACDALRVVGSRTFKDLRANGYTKPIHIAPVPVFMQPSCKTTPSPHQGKIVLFVGRLVAVKNLESWIRIARNVAGRIDNVKFVWAGDGPWRERLKRYAQELDIADQLTMLGAVPYSQLSEHYSNADVFLLTSHFEGFGRVLVEAGRHGVPAVAPEICGAEDIIESGKTGFLCHAGDEQGLADAVVRLLEDDGLREKIGAAAHKNTTEKYDTYEMAKRWVEIWLQTLS